MIISRTSTDFALSLFSVLILDAFSTTGALLQSLHYPYSLTLVHRTAQQLPFLQYVRPQYSTMKLFTQLLPLLRSTTLCRYCRPCLDSTASDKAALLAYLLPLLHASPQWVNSEVQVSLVHLYFWSSPICPCTFQFTSY
jgi:hypothetical protein